MGGISDNLQGQPTLKPCPCHLLLPATRDVSLTPCLHCCSGLFRATVPYLMPRPSPSSVLTAIASLSTLCAPLLRFARLAAAAALHPASTYSGRPLPLPVRALCGHIVRAHCLRALCAHIVCAHGVRTQCGRTVCAHCAPHLATEASLHPASSSVCARGSCLFLCMRPCSAACSLPSPPCQPCVRPCSASRALPPPQRYTLPPPTLGAPCRRLCAHCLGTL